MPDIEKLLTLERLRPGRPSPIRMTVLLYHRNLSLTSGTGQLVHMQARHLKQRGEKTLLACQRRGFKFFLRTGLPARSLSVSRVRKLAARNGCLLVDHGMLIPQADLVFVHNVVTEANRHLNRQDLQADVTHEQAFFRDLDRYTRLVANSNLTRSALASCFDLEPDRITVAYPGFRSDRFSSATTRQLRTRARRQLGIADDVPLIGFVTSGDFHKRGLDLFLRSARRILAARDDARFLVVGSRRLPGDAAADTLHTGGALLHRPKSHQPQLWMSALDLFLYPARFEEFGMVVAEAQASGIAVVTSRRVGAAECLPDVYRPWLTDTPEPEALADNALALLDQPGTRQALADAGIASVAALDQHHYARRTVDTILAQKRLLR